MNGIKREVLKEILGTIDLNSDKGKQSLIYNFNYIDIAFQELENERKGSPFLQEIVELHMYISNLYRTIVLNYINEFAESVYGKSIDFILTNYHQEEISSKLEHFLNTKGFPQQFKSDVFNNVKILAERLDKRFSFDEVALINLIEASMGNNIIVEAGTPGRYRDQVLSNENGTYEFKTSQNKKLYTHSGKEILSARSQDRQKEEDIQINSFPLGNKFLNTDNALKKVMEILFENLNLCIETYNSIYSKGDNIIENTALLSDGSTFDFEYILNEHNIPHLLGFQRGNTLNQRVLDTLNNIMRLTRKPIRNNHLILLSERSSALDVLLVILANQKNIIESGGLYEDNGKKYEILNWEKIILKTSSFMRGDFFKTCFCLTKLASNKYLVDSRKSGGYVSISSTDYNDGLNSSMSARMILNDLLDVRKQRRDYIFRSFMESDNQQRVDSIVTGKAETILVGRNNELLRTLQKYRNIFRGTTGFVMQTKENPNESSGDVPIGNPNDIDKEALLGSIVEEIENEKFIRKFTPLEQAQLGISISRDLLVVPHLSQEALDVLQNIHTQSGAVSEIELDEFSRVQELNNKKKK